MSLQIATMCHPPKADSIGISGKKIFLRLPAPDDIALLYKWENDKSIRSAKRTDSSAFQDGIRLSADRKAEQFSSAKKPFTKQEIKNFICNSYHDIYLEKQLRLMICLIKDKGQFANPPEDGLAWARGRTRHGEGTRDNKKNLKSPIGCIDLFDFDSIHLSAEIGILIGEKKQRGNRYASEALRLLIRHCFRKMNLRQLCCHVSATNKPALSLFLKQGFSASPQTPLLKERGEEERQKRREEIYFLRLLNIPMLSALGG